VTRGQLPQRAGSLGLTAVGLPPRYPRFDTVPARDGQTDRQTDRHVAIDINRASIASRG